MLFQFWEFSIISSLQHFDNMSSPHKEIETIKKEKEKHKKREKEP